ncbi:hypothetical protein GCM10009534_35120 [Kribbella sandramycini]
MTYNHSYGLAPTDPLVVCWRDLDSASAAEEVGRLTEWVVWVAGRYNLDHKVVPPCWPEHGAVIEELSALRTFWESCYQDDAGPSEPLAFHRDLTLALRRLRDWTSLLGCSRTNHRSEVSPLGAGP